MLKTCDVWEQDCDEGEKCQAWYDTEYNPPVCLPVSGDGAAGEPCEVSPDGIDDCGADSQCWNVDPMTKVGTCIPRCDGTAEMPECPEGATCSSYFDGTINVCVLDCDPLEGVEACAEDEVCSPMNGDFHCFPAGGAMGLGEDCEFLNSCAPGLVCVPADLVIGCEESKVGNCCSPACDLTDPNGCDALPGNECKPWDEEQPESALGICALY